MKERKVMKSEEKKKGIKKVWIILAACALLVGGTILKNNSKKADSTQETALGKEDDYQEKNENVTFDSEELAYSGGTIDLISAAGIEIEEDETSAEGPINVSEDFVNGTADFSIELLKKCVSEEENVLISPLSAQIVLSMTANGADNETLSQMERVLGGNQDISEINKNIKQYTNMLAHDDSSMIKFADSIWIKNKSKFKVRDEFLNIAANYYYAEVYGVPFDDSTVNDVNCWVSDNTDGKIKNMVSQFSNNTELFLINTVLFDGKWKKKYEKSVDGRFTTYKGETKDIQVMKSTESYYIKDDLATGFCKPYTTGYSFVAILPDEGVDIMDYIMTLDGEHFVEMLEEAFKNSGTDVDCTLPKITVEGKYELSEALKEMGMAQAFQYEADFSNMVEPKDGDSAETNMSIGSVAQKTYISVDESGTEAAAATGVAMKENAMQAINYRVDIDRPFIYAIVDNEKKLPIFIGTILDLKE